MTPHVDPHVASGHFGGAATAAAYASGRPALHSAVLDLIRGALPGRLRLAVDVGCGAGASTRALLGLSTWCLGLDPSPAMIGSAIDHVPGARFVVGSAERLPLQPASVDLITAAGSLDFADVHAFGREAHHVLAPHGRVVVYDFARGRRLRGSDALDPWYAEYLRRSGRAPAIATLPGRLADVPSLRLDRIESFTLPVRMTRAAYVDYVMTDAAVSDDPHLRAWCTTTLTPIFEATADAGAEVEFDGYVALLSPAR